MGKICDAENFAADSKWPYHIGLQYNMVYCGRWEQAKKIDTTSLSVQCFSYPYLERAKQGTKSCHFYWGNSVELGHESPRRQTN